MTDFVQGLAALASCVLFLSTLVFLSGCAVTAGEAPSSWRVARFRCEFLKNPIGIDEPRPRLSWIVTCGRRGARQTAYRILAASTREKLAAGEADLWDSGRIPSNRTAGIPYGGRALSSGERCYWKVRAFDEKGTASPWGGPAFFEMGLLDPSDWRAEWIGCTSDAAPSPFLRREFLVEKPVAAARLYATALGVYEMHLNGARVGRAFFTPGWTDYTKRIQYQTFDVTELIRRGENALGAILGDGWYAGALGWEAKRHNYGPYPLGFLAFLRVDFSDGTMMTVATGPGWKASAGPILSSEFLMGETYDGRKEMSGWDRPGFDDSSWRAVSVLPRPAARLSAQCSPMVEREMELRPVAVAEPRPGVFVFDLGQNMVGFARLKVRGAAGTKVRLRFAEALNKDGTIYTANLRKARSTDTYILKGGGEEEIFEPHFTFHGFRYVEVSGYPGEPERDAVTGVVIHSAVPRCGNFSCSNDMVNRLYENILWSQRGNFLSVPTDCPQRDERLGWMGDAQIFAPTACCNMDMAAFYTKWMRDVEDAQSAGGAFPDVAPRMVALEDGAPAWGDAGVIVPWTCLLFYGDREIAARHFEAMEKWMDYIGSANPDGLRLNRLNNNYGDWVSLDAKTPKEVLATAYYARCADLMARMADFLGRKKAAVRYRGLFSRIREAFNKAYVSDDGRIEGDTQTCYVLALAFDLLPGEKRAAAAERLVSDIEEKHGGHLSTGFLGVGHLLPVLTRFGRTDTAYRLLLNETYPSWGYCIREGATTIWERWDGYTEEKGFQDPGMNSFNHYAFGSVGAWLVASVAGIAPDPARPGFEHVLIAPRPSGALTRAGARYDSVRGTIESSWRKRKDRLVMEVTIPANTTAAVRVPARSAAEVLEGGRPAAEARGVRFRAMEGGAAVFDVASGRYSFSAPWPGEGAGK